MGRGVSKSSKGKKEKPIISKTARASAPKAASTVFHASGDLDRIIPCQDGYAYLRDPRSGALLHLRVGSDTWNLFVQDLLETEHGSRIEDELVRFGYAP